MLDNFYIVKQTIRQIEEDLPDSFLNELPKLSETSLQGHTRIFALAREWIGYSQGQIDLTQAAIFIQDYQQVMPLTIGELWALPIMLRIGILERLVYATSELTGIEVPKSLSEIPIQFAVTLPNDTIVANCFLSLRLLSATDWKDFFEADQSRGTDFTQRPRADLCGHGLRHPQQLSQCRLKNWRVTQNIAKSRSRSPQLNLPAMRKTNLQREKHTLAFI